MTAAFDAQILARTIYGEARGEPFEGKLAVGWVIVTRWKSKKWFAGKTIASTAMKARQFSCWNDADPNRERMCDASEEQLSECLSAAMAAILGTIADPTGGCTHYLAEGASAPWGDREPDVVIGRHRFWRNIP